MLGRRLIDGELDPELVKFLALPNFCILFFSLGCTTAKKHCKTLS
jgi:hypothetical protein